MIDVKDLRLGNWIEQKDRCFQVTKEMMQHYLEWGCIDNAIPLSVQWLLKAGFKPDISIDDETGFTFTSPDLDFVEWYDLLQHNTGFYLTRFNGFQTEQHIKYVHQLQNLFHALTGTELTFDK